MALRLQSHSFERLLAVYGAYSIVVSDDDQCCSTRREVYHWQSETVKAELTHNR